VVPPQGARKSNARPVLPPAYVSRNGEEERECRRFYSGEEARRAVRVALHMRQVCQKR